jgi:hypothetical protein
VAARQVELTYSGIKTGFDYFFPDQHPDPLFPEHTTAVDQQCVPLATFGLAPLSAVEEQQVARYGYDQATVDAEARVWLQPHHHDGDHDGDHDHDGDDDLSDDASDDGVTGDGAPPTEGLVRRGGVEKSSSSRRLGLRRLGAPLPTEAASGCLGPTRRAVAFFCLRLAPVPNHCVRDIHAALISHLIRDDDRRWTKAGPVGIDYYQMMR